MSDTLTPLATDTTTVDDQTDAAAAGTTIDDLVEDQLVEEVSIDGMCGVY